MLTLSPREALLLMRALRSLDLRNGDDDWPAKVRLYGRLRAIAAQPRVEEKAEGAAG
jgi:hypothetical protein